MGSPLDFLTTKQWNKLCKKYDVSVNHKPKRLGSGISATAYTFGKKLVIKHTDCNNTVDVAKKLLKKKVAAVAKVYEVNKVTVNHSTGYYIIQEFVRARSSAKVREFCDNFERLTRVMDEVSPKHLKTFVDIAFKLNQCGIDLSEVSDLHNENVYATRKGQIKIIDLGCLSFGG